MAVLLSISAGCAGARTNVVADTAKYPISLSRAVRNADGSLVAHEQVATVGKLRYEAIAWGLLYSALRLNPRTDISKAVNGQVAAVHGDAVVNLRIIGTQCAADYVPLVSLVPIWPGCASIVVEGDIIKVVRASVEARAALGGARVASRQAER